MLLENEIYKDDENMIIDECLTFIIGSTQTTSNLITTAMYWSTRFVDLRSKIKEEIKKVTKKDSFAHLKGQ